MPGGVSGLELAREIRRRRPDLPILLTTGSVSAPAGMETDEFPLLLKPYSADSLARALERRLRYRCGADGSSALLRLLSRRGGQ